MKAVVLEKPCRARDLKVSEVNTPGVKTGWVLVKIKAFGLNRSELFTRNGDSPSVTLPRILGIECVGEIADPSDSDFMVGQKVVSLMGGLGRDFDGSYAEYTLIPKDQVYPIDTAFDWVTLASIPETFYTVYGSLIQSLHLKSTETLLIRGGTSSAGLTALQLAKSMGVTVISTTRDIKKTDLLKNYGADHVIVDNGNIINDLFKLFPDGVDKILELVGSSTIKNSLQLLAVSGILCMTGILGGWVIDEFEPLVDIPSGRYFTTFESSKVDVKLLTDLFELIAKKQLFPIISKVFTLDEIAEAHAFLEENTANGKVVVVNP